ncbi:MAG: hypothetical protein BroJett030_19440 [Alphaproteobacteria bacterium]|nr:MAG: hypothetical protein BroJett030_19440 [Alphaproteobacteria bacterium]
MTERGSIARGGRVALLVGVLALAACNSTTGNQVEGVLDPRAAAPGQDTQPTAADEVVDLRAYCPKTVMRAGTETYNAYPDTMKSDDPDKARKLRFRATIIEVVRECNYAGPMLNMKVGVAGRIVSGPGGETGDFRLPVRVAVTQGDTVLYSQLHDITATIPPGRPNNNFSFVDSAVSIPKPDKENIIIYVGFDELRVDLPNAVPPKDNLRPIN